MANKPVAGRRILPRAAVAVVTALAAVVAGGAVNAAPPAVRASDTIVVRWSAQLLENIRNSTLGPPMVARALAIVHTCMYDAWAAYDPVAAGTQYGGKLRRPAAEWTAANKSEAISYAAYRAAVDLFPGRKAQMDAFMASLGYDPARNPQESATPAGVGVTACAAVLAARHNDGSNQNGKLHSAGPYADWSNYQPANGPMVVAEPMNKMHVVDPNRWQPLTYPNKAGTVVTPKYLAGHWGNVRSFAMNYGEATRFFRELPKYGSPEFARQTADVLAISANLTDRQKASAEYWADGPNSEQPPGHWLLFAQFVSQRNGHTIDQDAKMFFAVANAVMDAGIAAWSGKRAMDSVRPITAIRYQFHGQQVRAWAGPGKGTQVIDGATWLPYQPVYFPTPPFPEYVSGHSTFSAAGAEVLKSFTGSDAFGYTVTVRAGSSFVEPGVAPSTDQRMAWATFSEAADDAGMSRRYGGIHFERGDLDGRALGRHVGQRVWSKAAACFAGNCSG